MTLKRAMEKGVISLVCELSWDGGSWKGSTKVDLF